MTDTRDGKPDWYVGYATAVAKYVSERDANESRYGHYRVGLTDLARHMVGCSVETIHHLDEEVMGYEEHDSYGNVSAMADTTIHLQFTCACGEYKNASAKVQETLDSVIHGVLLS